MLHSGFIEHCKTRPACISPIKVVPKKRHLKFHLITALITLNEYYVTQKFCYEDIKVVQRLIRPNDQMVLLVLKKTFHHVPIKEDHRDYFGFQFDGQFY